MKTAKTINLIGGILAVIFSLLAAMFSKLVISLMTEFGDFAADPEFLMSIIPGTSLIATMLLMFFTFVLFIYGIVAIIFNAKAQMEKKALGIIAGALSAASFLVFLMPIVNVVGGLVITLMFFLAFFLGKEKEVMPMGGASMNGGQGQQWQGEQPQNNQDWQNNQEWQQPTQPQQPEQPQQPQQEQPQQPQQEQPTQPQQPEQDIDFGDGPKFQ